ncbi:MAG TPA: efflux transporter periplasmic adaptor subunit, partial [Casimicrobiaceae bacterium]
VYVVGQKDGKDVAVPRPVVVGDWVSASGANEWVIESGLKPGDPVVVNGVAKVMPGAPIDTSGGAAAKGGAPGAPAGAGKGHAPEDAAAKGNTAPAKS